MKTIALAASILAASTAPAVHADDSYITAQASDYKNSTIRVGHITNSKMFVIGDGSNRIETYLAAEIEAGRERVHAGPALHLIRPIADWPISSDWDIDLIDLVTRVGIGLTTTTPARSSAMGSIGMMLINSNHGAGIEVGVRKASSLSTSGYLSISKFF